MVAREVIFDALLATLQASAGTLFKTYTRRWKSAWDDPQQMVPLMPMLVQFEDRENVTWENRGIGRVLKLGLRLELYGKIPVGPTIGVRDMTTPGSKVLNPLLDAVDNALLPGLPLNPDGLQTLGGVVYDCRVEGEVIKVLGDEDPSGLCGAIVPVSIFVPY